MTYSIENNYLKVLISSKGAEIKSITDKKTQKELIWQGDANFWNRSSPILFPIVGRLLNNTYQYQGNSFQLNQHGFARDNEFNVINNKVDEITFQLFSNNDTIKNYPFDLELQTTYSLTNNELEVTYEVKNKDNKNLLYSLGAHPGFNIPLASLEANHFQLKFNTKKDLIPRLLEGPYLTDKLVEKKLSNPLPITNQIFNEIPTILLDQFPIDSVDLNDENENLILTVKHDAPYLGIWSSPGPFICIEPWWGLPDTLNHDQNLRNKKGIIEISANSSHKHQWSILIAQ